MSDLTKAACAGKWWLFESTSMTDHVEARALCDACPARAACALLLVDVLANCHGTRESGGGPVGTWAGRLYGSKGLIASCGTDSGYRRHTRLNEEPCTHCKAAHSKSTSRRRKKAA